MKALLERMEPEELAALRPFESVVHVPDAEEEWALLERMIGRETTGQIRQHAILFLSEPGDGHHHETSTG